MWKRRLLFFILFVFCIWFALLTRSHAAWFPGVIAEFGGDIFWAAGFLFLVKTIFLRKPDWKLAIISYLLGVFVELQQLLQFSWLVAIRDTQLGAKMLGIVFVWTDLVCYAIGILLAFFTLRLVARRSPVA
ncbi:MAG: hypothetical protein K0Q66_1432 [Chitinophagaceae bacterium]|jgi:hypothetical protein|nr:hypothetical protein [Chitinophagaceae bacterium]